MADVPVLVCTAGELAGSTIRVPEGGLDIGRAEENHVVVRDDGVSRFHARLLYDNGSLWLQDAGSRNGVFVNGVRVTGHKALKVGDEITIALHTFTVQIEDDVVREEAEDSGVMPGPPEASTAGDAPDQSRPAGARQRRWFWPFS